MTRVLETAGNLLLTALQTAREAVRMARAARQSHADPRTPETPLDVEEVEILTFRDAVTWLTKNRPSDRRVAKAAVLREKQDGGLKVTTVFLNQAGEVVRGENDLPLGRAQRVVRLDQELEGFFGNRDMVLFE